MKLTTNGNYAICEYPPCDVPEFDLNEDVLFVFGYSIKFLSGQIGTAQRFQADQLKGYKIIGRYHEAIITKEVSAIVESRPVDVDNCLILCKNN